MFSVTQQIDFCYGHRLINYDGKCAHPHGHNAVAELTFESKELNRLGMVVDFGEIKAKMKTWIDQTLDHRMILEKGDPLIPLLQGLKEPVFQIDGAPTAEQLAKIIFDRAKTEGLPIVQVKIWETPTQQATYRG